MAFNSGERETVYKEYSCARWNYWTYDEGRRVPISQRQYNVMIKQGANNVVVK